MSYTYLFILLSVLTLKKTVNEFFFLEDWRIQYVRPGTEVQKCLIDSEEKITWIKINSP